MVIVYAPARYHEDPVFELHVVSKYCSGVEIVPSRFKKDASA